MTPPWTSSLRGRQRILLESMGIDSKDAREVVTSTALTTPSIRSRSTATPQRRPPLPQPANRSPTQAKKAEELAEAFGEQMTDEQLASMTKTTLPQKSAKSPCRPSTRRAIDMPLVLTFTKKNDNEWTPTPTCSDRC